MSDASIAAGTQPIDIDEMPDELRPQWPVGTEPTAAEWQTWFVSLPTEWRELFADRMLTHQRYDTHCFQNDHIGRIKSLESRLIAAESAAERYRSALTAIQRKATDGLR